VAKTKKKKQIAEIEPVAANSDGGTFDPILEAHESWEHVFINPEDPDVFLDEHGHVVKLNEHGEPIYDEGTGYPKTKKPRAAKSKTSKVRVVKVKPNDGQKALLGEAYSDFVRVRMADGSYVRTMNEEIEQIQSLEGDKLVLGTLIAKGSAKKKENLTAFIQHHVALAKRNKAEFVFCFAKQDGSLTPTIGFQGTHPGVSLNVALKLCK